MRSILHLHKLLIVVGLLLIAVGCTQAASTEPDTSAISKDYQSYSKDGLNLRYPKHWSFAYDDSPAIYADRDASFNPTEFSKVSVLIYKENTVDETEVASMFERASKLKSSKNVEDYLQTPVSISGFKGLRLTWKNILLDPISIEMTILKIKDSPKPVFVVFKLTDEDIENETVHIASFIKSISFQ
jgi:hypothetical protein